MTNKITDKAREYLETPFKHQGRLKGVGVDCIGAKGRKSGNRFSMPVRPKKLCNQELINTARTYLGTPFKHQGRLKGVGVDCIGLIMCVLKELGSPIANLDETNYKRRPEGNYFLKKLQDNLTQISLNEASAGDIILFPFKGNFQHGAIISEIEFKPSSRGAKRRSDPSTDFSKKVDLSMDVLASASPCCVANAKLPLRGSLSELCRVSNKLLPRNEKLKFVRIIHSYAANRKVVEHQIPPQWLKEDYRVFKL